MGKYWQIFELWAGIIAIRWPRVKGEGVGQSWMKSMINRQSGRKVFLEFICGFGVGDFPLLSPHHHHRHRYLCSSIQSA